MSDTSATTAAHLPAYFRLMLFELGKQSEWGASVGKQIVAGTGNVWTQLHLFAIHAGTVGAFVQTFKSRRNELKRLFPDRSEAIRQVTRTLYDFSEVIEFRHAMSHLDERIEYRWHQLARDDEDPPQLLVRAEGDLSDGRERLLNWSSSSKVASFLRRDGTGWHDIDIAEVTREIEAVQQLSTHEYMSRALGVDWVNVVRRVTTTTPPVKG